MKKAAVLLLVVCLAVSVSSAALAGDPAFVTVQEWLDAKGECGDCLVALRIQAILNPVLAVGEDETGTVNLFSGNGEDSFIVNFMDEERTVAAGDIIIIANPRYNVFGDTVEMADWTLLRVFSVTREAE